MRIKRVFPNLLLCVAAAAQGQAFGQDDDAYYFRRLTPPPITNLTVTHASQRSESAAPEVTCEDFRLSAREARRFLKQATAVTRRDYRGYHAASPCRAEGTVSYRNGMRAEWQIESGGRGLLMPINGRNKDVLYYLYCETCFD